MHFKTKLLKILLLILAVTGIFVFSTKEPFYDTTEEVPEVEEEVFYDKDTIYFWYADEAMSDFFNSAAVVFGEKYGVRVIPKLVSASEYLESINRATLQEAQMPDAYFITNDSLEKAYLSGLAVEITDENKLVTENNFSKAALDAVTYKGKMVAYPVTYETTALLYNESFLQEWALQQVTREAEDAGVTYDEATLLAKRDELMLTAIPSTIEEMLLMSDSFDPPETVEGILKWDVSDIFYNYHFVGNYMVVGGDCGDDKTNINVNNPEAIACLEVYKALNQFFYIESDLVSYESVVQDFLDGKLVYTIATTDAVAMVEKAIQEGTFAYNYGVALMPDPTQQLKGRSLSVTGTVAINGYSQNRDLANKFAAFLTGEYASDLYTRSGKCAANIKVASAYSALDIFRSEYAESVPLNKMVETSNFWVQLEILFSKVWNGGDINALVAQLEQQLMSQTTSE